MHVVLLWGLCYICWRPAEVPAIDSALAEEVDVSKRASFFYGETDDFEKNTGKNSVEDCCKVIAY